MNVRFFVVFLALLTISAPAMADCDLGGGNGTRPEGTVVFNEDFDTLQVCTGSTWMAAGLADVGSSFGCGTIGDVCSNGSVYAGISPDGGVAMYATAADAPGTYTWNNDTANWTDTVMVNCNDTAESSCETGEDNTTLLAGLSDSASPYEAAEYCAGLTAHGNSDWYLPSLNELDILFDNRVAIDGFNTGGSWYWSSSEFSDDNARELRFSDGQRDFGFKDANSLVRCVRK